MASAIATDGEGVQAVFHQATQSCTPKGQLKPASLWVAILGSSNQLLGPKQEKDYLWIKANSNLPISKIYSAYLNQLPSDDRQKMKLKFGNGFLDPNDQRPMRSLDPLGSQLVALRAVPSDAPVKRNPLQVATPQSTNSRVPSIDRGTISRSTSKSHSNSIPLFPDLQSWTPGGAQDENRPPSHSSYVSSSTYTPPPAPSHTLARLDAASQPLQHAETPRGDSGVTQSPSLAQLSRTPSSTASTGMRDQNASANNADDVRSLKLKNRFLNIAFQRYLTEFYETTKATTGHYSAPYVYDLAWDAWSRLPPKELESYIAKGTRVAQGMPEWSDLETMKEMLQNVKPELAEESKGPMEDDSQEIKPELDFKEQFGEVEQPPSQSEVVQRQSFQLQEFTANVTLDILEASVQRGLQYLEDLKKPLVAKLDVSPDAANWVKSIENLQKSATKVRTVIGVVGSTGAGKSSVINAMLDEERLLPTNTMRACTAVVTELSYNSDDRAYRAEIEFISEDDWRKELTILFQDLVAEDGTVSKDCTDPDSEAGVAYAKIRAVYHKKTKEDIGKGSDVESLLKEVSHILGKTEVIRQNDSLMFYRRLQHFIDSKEKSTGRDKKDKTERVMEMWPLIKVVRIYVKSPALLTGAVIVDLPGVHDANAARAAVADGYMKQCTGLWIVAPIIRAVDDKSAKKLLGESFKRQLKMDGGYNAVSFICSKTDDISLTEASDSLGLDDVNAPRWKEIDECDDKQKALKKELDQHTETQGDYFAAMEECDIQIDAWDALLQKVEDGKTVYPLTEGKKRKRGGRYKSNKRQKSTTDSDDDFIDDSSVHAESDEEEDGDDDADDLELDHPEPLTKEDITAKLAEIKETKKEARKHRAELTATVKATKNAMVKVKETRAKIESEISRVCIEGRNDYSRGAIKVDFAAGIKELDQELAAEEDDENFDPDVEIRDYDEVARKLKVFCVSSRAYQGMQGHFKKDAKVSGFSHLDQTEIPALQAHCESLTREGRTVACKRFMTNLSQLLNSMTLWASNDGSGSNLTADEKEKEARYLSKSLKNLESGLEKLVESTYKELTEEFATNIFEKYEVAVGTAREKAKEISVHWGSTVNRQDRSQGGVHFSTYKAICRRSGIYTGGSTGAHDWNGQLMEPLIQHIAAGWEKNFTRRVPAVMQGLARNSNNLLRLFHRDVAQRAQTTGTGLAGLNMLEQQLQNYDEMFKDLAGTSKDNINKEQREINREFVPIIQNALLQAYTSSAEERGRGSFARMKGHVVGHIEHQRHQMFQDSCDHVRILLRKVLRGVEELMENKAEEVFQMMKLDYCAVLGGGVDIPQGQVAPRWQREMRGSVMKLINSAEKIFKRVAGIEVEDDENVDDAAVDDAMAIEQPEEESAVDTYAVDEFAVVESSKVIEEADSVQGSDGSADLERESAIADGGKARVIPEHPVADDSDDELLGPNDIIQAILNKTSSLKRTTTTESAKVVPAADQDAAPKLMESKVNSPALLSADIHGATTDLVRHNDSVPPSPHPGEYSESAPEDSEPAHGRWDAYDESTEESESDQDHDKMDTQEEFLSSYEDNDE